MTLDDQLARLKRLHPLLIDLSLGRIERLLVKLGNPHERLPAVIHVAGTNGKGSVTAMLRAMLEAAGRRVHVYTSPHLVRFNERIAVAGADGRAAPIAEDRLADAAGRGRARQRRRSHDVLRDHDRGRVPGVCADAGRRGDPGGRARRPARCDQCDRAAEAVRHHAGRARPCRQARRHGGQDRGGEGRHPEARCGGRDRAPGR